MTTLRHALASANQTSTPTAQVGADGGGSSCVRRSRGERGTGAITEGRGESKSRHTHKPCPSSYGASASGRTRYVAAKPRTAEESISARRIVERVVGHRRSDGVRSSASPERGGPT
jgi:hypothetical protein